MFRKQENKLDQSKIELQYFLLYLLKKQELIFESSFIDVNECLVLNHCIESLVLQINKYKFHFTNFSPSLGIEYEKFKASQ